MRGLRLIHVLIYSCRKHWKWHVMMSWQGNAFHVTDPLWGESTTGSQVDFLHIGSVVIYGIVMLTVLLTWMKSWTDSQVTGDLTCYDTHVTSLSYISFPPNKFKFFNCGCQQLHMVSIQKQSGAWFNIKMTSYQYCKSYCGDKTILRPSYLHNEISYTGKMTFLYWIRAQNNYLLLILLWFTHLQQNKQHCHYQQCKSMTTENTRWNNCLSSSIPKYCHIKLLSPGQQSFNNMIASTEYIEHKNVNFDCWMCMNMKLTFTASLYQKHIFEFYFPGTETIKWLIIDIMICSASELTDLTHAFFSVKSLALYQ